MSQAGVPSRTAKRYLGQQKADLEVKTALIAQLDISRQVLVPLHVRHVQLAPFIIK